MAFLVINIPAPIEPLERGDRFEDPLSEAFAAEGISGGPCGGGTALKEVAGRKVITSCDIEVELEDGDLGRALPVIRRVLIAGGAPPGTTIRQCEPEEALYPLHED
jgi:hypothetical protein